MSTIATTSKQEFKEKVLDNKKIVLVDFWAAWCAPCRAMAPVLEKASNKYAGKLEIVKINIEESPENGELASEYGVQGIPNMQVFKEGKVIDEFVGMMSELALEDALEKHLKV